MAGDLQLCDVLLLAASLIAAFAIASCSISCPRRALSASASVCYIVNSFHKHAKARPVVTILVLSSGIMPADLMSCCWRGDNKAAMSKGEITGQHGNSTCPW